MRVRPGRPFVFGTQAPGEPAQYRGTAKVPDGAIIFDSIVDQLNCDCFDSRPMTPVSRDVSVFSSITHLSIRAWFGLSTSMRIGKNWDSTAQIWDRAGPRPGRRRGGLGSWRQKLSETPKSLKRWV